MQTNLEDLAHALPSEDTNEAQAMTLISQSSKLPTAIAKITGQSGKKRPSEEKLFKTEIHRFKSVLALPEYKANPFDAIKAHVAATLDRRADIVPSL